MIINNCKIELIQGDITTQKVDAIVNAANKALAGGAGVDGAIHRAGGPSILEECNRIGRCAEGHAVITKAGHLPSQYVIHTVGPIYSEGAYGQAQVLAGAYRNSLKLAVEYSIATIAFPSISTGAFRYPLHDAAKIALQTVVTFLATENHDLETVRFVLFDEKTFRIYSEELRRFE